MIIKCRQTHTHTLWTASEYILVRTVRLYMFIHTYLFTTVTSIKKIISVFYYQGTCSFITKIQTHTHTLRLQQNVWDYIYTYIHNSNVLVKSSITYLNFCETSVFVRISSQCFSLNALTHKTWKKWPLSIMPPECPRKWPHSPSPRSESVRFVINENYPRMNNEYIARQFPLVKNLTGGPVVVVAVGMLCPPRKAFLTWFTTAIFSNLNVFNLKSI